MISTFIAYGYKLGGPGDWRLKDLASGQPLKTTWYDETDPTHDFPAKALAEISDTVPEARTNRHLRRRLESSMPYEFDAAIELSPPGWTREASAPPMPVGALSPSAPIFGLDTITPARYVLVVLDSIEDIEEKEAEYYAANEDEDEEEAPDALAWPIDWDNLLDAALMELGLHAADTPDWFWYRTGIPD